MKFLGLDGRTHSINIVGRMRTKCSDGHKRARALLKQLFPFDTVVEEFTIPGSKLYLDFFIPKQMLCLEVQGTQHYAFNAFYHRDKAGFVSSQNRDKSKVEWCELNNFDLVELPDTESDDEWKIRIVNRGQTSGDSQSTG